MMRWNKNELLIPAIYNRQQAYDNRQNGNACVEEARVAGRRYIRS